MKQYLIAAAIMAVAASAAQAQGYVSAGIGQGHIQTDCDGVSDCKSHGTAYKFLGGWRFGNSGLAAELGYQRFGRASANDAGADVRLQAGGMTLGLAWQQQFNADWGMGARLGLVRMKTKFSASGVGGSFSDSETRTKPYVGVSLSYTLTPGTKLELGADFSRAEYDGQTGSARSITIGLQQSF